MDDLVSRVSLPWYEMDQDVEKAFIYIYIIWVSFATQKKVVGHIQQ